MCFLLYSWNQNQNISESKTKANFGKVNMTWNNMWTDDMWYQLDPNKANQHWSTLTNWVVNMKAMLCGVMLFVISIPDGRPGLDFGRPPFAAHLRFLQTGRCSQTFGNILQALGQGCNLLTRWRLGWAQRVSGKTFQDGTKKQNQEEHMQMIPRMHIRYGVMMWYVNHWSQDYHIIHMHEF